MGLALSSVPQEIDFTRIPSRIVPTLEYPRKTLAQAESRTFSITIKLLIHRPPQATVRVDQDLTLNKIKAQSPTSTVNIIEEV
jgi:hypothetical protein